MKSINRIINPKAIEQVFIQQDPTRLNQQFGFWITKFIESNKQDYHPFTEYYERIYMLTKIKLKDKKLLSYLETLNKDHMFTQGELSLEVLKDQMFDRSDETLLKLYGGIQHSFYMENKRIASVLGFQKENSLFFHERSNTRMTSYFTLTNIKLNPDDHHEYLFDMEYQMITRNEKNVFSVKEITVKEIPLELDSEDFSEVFNMVDRELKSFHEKSSK